MHTGMVAMGMKRSHEILNVYQDLLIGCVQYMEKREVKDNLFSYYFCPQQLDGWTFHRLISGRLHAGGVSTFVFILGHIDFDMFIRHSRGQVSGHRYKCCIWDSGLC